jgi:P27 family predicted phage terminase small subunit
MPRRPTPTYLRLMQGNPQKRPIRGNEPQPPIPDEVPEPPLFVTGYAADEYWRVAPGLHVMGLLTLVDVAPLAAYCCAYARWREAEEALERMRTKDPVMFGLILKTRAGDATQNPLVAIARKARLDMLRIAAEFGFTPAARSRIDAGPNGDATPNKFGDMLA